MRLIDADKLLKDIEQYHLSDGFFQHWVEVQPTIEGRKKGEWIDRGDHCVCNQCGHTEQQFNGVEPIPLHTSFCAICGADMRGDGNDN